MAGRAVYQAPVPLNAPRLIFVNALDFDYERAIQASFAAQSVVQRDFKISDVPSNEEVEAIKNKDESLFYCPICLDNIPNYKAYVFFNCDHKVCIDCARGIIDKKCPECRTDIFSGKLTKRKIDNVEKAFAQIESDAAVAKMLQEELDGELYDSDASTVMINSDDDRDMIGQNGTKKAKICEDRKPSALKIEKSNLSSFEKKSDNDDEFIDF